MALESSEKESDIQYILGTSNGFSWDKTGTNWRIAPILGLIGLPLVIKRMNATLVNTEPPSI